jgi:hypothetical protein
VFKIFTSIQQHNSVSSAQTARVLNTQRMAQLSYTTVGFRLSVYLAPPIAWDQVMLLSSSGKRATDWSCTPVTQVLVHPYTTQSRKIKFVPDDWTYKHFGNLQAQPKVETDWNRKTLPHDKFSSNTGDISKIPEHDFFFSRFVSQHVTFLKLPLLTLVLCVCVRAC